MQADKPFLVSLKAAQESARLANDETSSLIKEAARARVEALLETALKCTQQRSRVRDFTGAEGSGSGGRWLGGCVVVARTNPNQTAYIHSALSL